VLIACVFHRDDRRRSEYPVEAMSVQRFRGRFFRGWLLHGMVVAVAGAAVTSSGCGKEERGQLTLAFTTDMDVPGDVKKIVLQVNQVNGSELAKETFEISADPATGRLSPSLPATLAVFMNEEPETPQSVRVRLAALGENDRLIGLRELSAVVPTAVNERPVVRMPLTWLSGYAFEQQQGKFVSGLSSIETKCDATQVFSTSGCVDAIKDPARVPIPFAADEVARPTACFSAQVCFGKSDALRAKEVVVEGTTAGDCYMLIPEPSDSLSLAFSVAPNRNRPQAGFGLSLATRLPGSALSDTKIIVLERGDVDGWSIESVDLAKSTKIAGATSDFAKTFRQRRSDNSSLLLPRLPKTLCEAIIKNDVDFIFPSAACALPGPRTQMCSQVNAPSGQVASTGAARDVSKDSEFNTAYTRFLNGR
jgi:hypothetical protein